MTPSQAVPSMAEAIQKPAGRKPTGLSRRYLAGWGLLAGCALVYLALLMARPDLAGVMIGRSPGSDVETGRGQRTAASGGSELDEARRAVTLLQSEIAALRGEAAARDRRDQALAARVAALETSPIKAPDIVQTAPTIQTAAEAPTGPADKSNLLSGVTVQGKVDDKPVKTAPRPAVAAAQPSTTGTLPAPARAAPPTAVRIASGPSLDALRLSWQLLLEGNRPVLKPLEPRWMEMTGEPGSFALIAGPAGSPEDAAKICATLKAKRIPCAVTRFGGQSL